MNILDYSNPNVGEFRVSDSIEFDRIVDGLNERQRTALARKIAHEVEVASGSNYRELAEELEDDLKRSNKELRRLELRVVDLEAQLAKRAG